MTKFIHKKWRDKLRQQKKLRQSEHRKHAMICARKIGWNSGRCSSRGPRAYAWPIPSNIWKSINGLRSCSWSHVICVILFTLPRLKLPAANTPTTTMATTITAASTDCRSTNPQANKQTITRPGGSSRRIAAAAAVTYGDLEPSVSFWTVLECKKELFF